MENRMNNGRENEMQADIARGLLPLSACRVK